MVQIFDNGPEFDSEVTTLDELLERLNEIKAAHPTALAATVKLAKWSDGQSELRFMTGAPGAAYESWVRSMNSGDETPYNMGVAP